MNAWLESLSALEYAALLVAVPATLVMLIQTALLLFGIHNEGDGDGDFDDGDLDLDADFDGDVDGDLDLDADGDVDIDDADTDADAGEEVGPGLFAGLRVLTLRGVVAFLAIFGWGTLWLLRVGLHPAIALFFGVAMGIWAMILVAILLRLALQLQEDGTVDIQNALGLSGTVYLTVPAARQGEGKVHLVVQDQLRELQAVTDEPQDIPTGTPIRVMGVSGRDTLVVEPK